MKEYNQLLQKSTHYGCSIYALLSLLRYDYGIFVDIDYTLKFLLYLEKIGVFFRLEGAIARFIYPKAIEHINSELGIKLKLKTSKLKLKTSKLDFELSKKHGYILGFKRATVFYKTKAEDGEVTKEEIDSFVDIKNNGHFHYWKRGRIVESLGGFRYKLSEKNLKHAYDLDLYYQNIRYITGEEELQKELIKIVKFRRLQKLPNPFVDYDEIIKIKKQLLKKNKD